MQRYKDWPERLARFLVERKSVPFDPQHNNCGLFVCDAVLAMTGVDMGVEFRAIEDLRELVEYVEEIAVRVAKTHGLVEINPAFAQRGDVLLVRNGDSKALAIVGMNGKPIGAGDGATELPTSACLKAWRIPS